MSAYRENVYRPLTNKEWWAAELREIADLWQDKLDLDAAWDHAHNVVVMTGKPFSFVWPPPPRQAVWTFTTMPAVDHPYWNIVGKEDVVPEGALIDDVVL